MAGSSRHPASSPPVTPAMRQYLDAKRLHRDTILFFRMGDFYEMFYEDALTASRALEIALTSRSKDTNGSAIPMCGVPHHAADGYIARLVKKGFRVAVCEQVEDARKAKGLVRREVVRIVSPGTLIDASHLDAREPSFLMAIALGRAERQEDISGVALLDLSTGEFTAAEYAGVEGRRTLLGELEVLRPRELLISEDLDLETSLPGFERQGCRVTVADASTFDVDAARRTLLDQLRTQSLDVHGLGNRPVAVAAAGALVQHVRDTQKADLVHVRGIRFREASDGLVLDATTLRHLEVVQSVEGGRPGSLLHELDSTVTAMGGRLLRAWLLKPLVTVEPIQDRLDGVEELAFHATERGKLRDTLKAVHDLERLVARASLGTAGPRDLVALRQSLTAIPRVKLILSELRAPLIGSLVSGLDEVSDVRDAIGTTLVDTPPALARDGGCVNDGVDPELDDLRTVSRSGKRCIAEMESAERRRTGISSLKIRFNRVFGYYIEVSKSNLHAVPDDYVRRQTVAGGERFVTPTLKEYEEKVLGADDRILEREVAIFEALRSRVAAEAPRIQDSARALASLDVLGALAETAQAKNYTKPRLHEGEELSVTEGRHPVVERFAPDPFVPNDVMLDRTEQQLVIVTGPNMGGKSTYLRQVALMSVLAQAGSFVPAARAKLPIVDRIFARVGASDNIARGQSTFMVEMQETAQILHAATARSLVVLDEIGRGTATYDGLSIAWAVAEFLATSPARPKTLFATHYHELTDLADALPGVFNSHVTVREWRDEIVFLRKVVSGRSDRSYGIQVARLAGLPPEVIERAREILQGLESDELSRGGRPSLVGSSTEPQRQLGLFQRPARAHDELASRLRSLDVDHMTPVDALNVLAALRRDVGE